MIHHRPYEYLGEANACLMNIFHKAQELIEKGYSLCDSNVIVHAEKPTSGKVGDKAIVTADGELHGWIGGSCAQPTVSKEGVKSLKDGQSRLIRLSANPAEMTPREGLIDFPMTCFSGGTLEIYIEPQYPKPRLIIVGTMSVAQTLIHLGKLMSYDVILVDPDGDAPVQAEAKHTMADLSKLGNYVRPDTYIVVATHGNFDEVAIENALKANASYIGLVSSKKRFEKVREYLTLQGISEDSIASIKAPAGLDIQARRGDEIALSIMAEIVQKRRNRELEHDLQAFNAKPLVAIDPVCGMEVEISTAKASYDYEGTTYYFCCNGCKLTFSKNPDKYLQKSTPAGEAIDPVCGMTVDIATAKYMSEYQGNMIYFCCAGCKMSFDKDPEQYLKAEEA